MKARDEGGWRCSLTGHDEVGLVWCCLIEMGMQVVGLKLRHDEDRRACLIIVDLDLRIVLEAVLGT